MLLPTNTAKGATNRVCKCARPCQQKASHILDNADLRRGRFVDAGGSCVSCDLNGDIVCGCGDCIADSWLLRRGVLSSRAPISTNVKPASANNVEKEISHKKEKKKTDRWPVCHALR